MYTGINIYISIFTKFTQVLSSFLGVGLFSRLTNDRAGNMDLNLSNKNNGSSNDFSYVALDGSFRLSRSCKRFIFNRGYVHDTLVTRCCQ
jgi:hypothetical protein